MEYCTTRFKNIVKHEYRLEVVTPLFLGGADPSTPELRVAPFKGMLRFWWRALYGSNDLKKMKSSEADIFGSTEKKSMLHINIVEASGIKVDRSNLPSGTEEHSILEQLIIWRMVFVKMTKKRR